MVIRKLRVWSATATLEPCRPYCILINGLYPLGQVIGKRICSPPDVFPTAQTILQCVVETMLDPPPSTLAQHRPDTICFPDKEFVGHLRKTFASIQVECSYLSESDGVDDYIQQLSNHLIQKEMADIAPVNSRPGLLKNENGITVDFLREFYRYCARYYMLQPWCLLSERQALQINVSHPIHLNKSHVVHTKSIFASVIASQTEDTFVRGLALFMCRSDLERRVLPKDEQPAHEFDATLRRCANCDLRTFDQKNKPNELKRCTRCKVTFYCNAECQRQHWNDHRETCLPPNDVMTSKWGMKEMSILFGPATAMPFDDLEAIDLHQFPIAMDNEEKGLQMYPAAVVFEKGTPRVPNASELLCLLRGLRAHVAVLEKFPLFMKESILELAGVTRLSDGKMPELTVDGTSFGFDDVLTLRNATILSAKEVEKVRLEADSVDKAALKRKSGERCLQKLTNLLTEEDTVMTAQLDTGTKDTQVAEGKLKEESQMGKEVDKVTEINHELDSHEAKVNESAKKKQSKGKGKKEDASCIVM